MCRSLWIQFLCVVLTSCATVRPATEQTRLEVQQASDQFWATRERGEVSAFAAQFTEDGIFMVPGLADAAGRSAIQELAKVRFASARITDFKVHRREIEVVGDSAYEVAWYSETHRGRDEALRLQGRYLLVWQRGTDRLWRVHRYFYNFSAAEPL